MKINAFSISAIATLASSLGISLFAAFHHRVETYDGVQTLFHMLNGYTHGSYINHRQLGVLTQSIAYAQPWLSGSLGLSFETLLDLFNYYVALHCTFVMALTFWLTWKLKLIQLIPFHIVHYALAIIPVTTIHMSLVPETLGYSYLAFLGFYFYNDKNYSFGMKLLTVFAMSMALLGYETSFLLFIGISIFLLSQFLKSQSALGWIKENSFYSFFFIVNFIIFLIRMSQFNSTGVYQKSLNDLFETIPFTLYFMLFATAAFSSNVLLKSTPRLKIFQKSCIAVCIGICLFIVTNHYKSDLIIIQGFSIRTVAFIFSYLFMLLIVIAHQRDKELKMSPSLVIISMLILLSSGLVDVQGTRYWSRSRNRAHVEFAQYKNGCHIIETNDWTTAYQSLLFQKSFEPHFIVFSKNHLALNNWRKDLCDPIESITASKKPHGLLFDEIRSFNFTGIFK